MGVVQSNKKLVVIGLLLAIKKKKLKLTAVTTGIILYMEVNTNEL